VISKKEIKMSRFQGSFGLLLLILLFVFVGWSTTDSQLKAQEEVFAVIQEQMDKSGRLVPNNMTEALKWTALSFETPLNEDWRSIDEFVSRDSEQLNAFVSYKYGWGLAIVREEYCGRADPWSIKLIYTVGGKIVEELVFDQMIETGYNHLEQIVDLGSVILTATTDFDHHCARGKSNVKITIK
jgi:hypothetical protein